MARLAATAVLLLLLLSLLAVASSRFIEAEPETVVAISDEQSQADPSAVPQEKDAAEAVPSLPTVTAVESILRLPSHRRPCRHGFLHRHLRWARNHGLSHHRGAFAGPGDARVVPAFLPEEPAREAEVEVVAEPDPDSRPHTDVEEVEEKYSKPPRGDGDGGEENELVKAWKGEMARRFHAHGLRFQNRHHHHEHAVEKDDSEHQEQQYKEEGAGDTQLQQHVKLFSRHFHHHNHGDEEQHEDTAAKHYFHHHHEVHDSDNEVDEVEDLARRLSKAIMRRSLSRGGNGIRHHLHHHQHHSEEGRVKKWFKSMIMNRF